MILCTQNLSIPFLTLELPTLDANVVEDLHEPNIVNSCSSFHGDRAL